VRFEEMTNRAVSVRVYRSSTVYTELRMTEFQTDAS
jgi:hypothetical protein